MLRQYFVRATASVCNIAIHAVVMVAVIKVARIADEWATSRQTLRLITVMTAATVLMVAKRKPASPADNSSQGTGLGD